VSTQPGQQTDFGANEWLVYEIHQQYLKDPDSVSPEWRSFLSDYDPNAAGGNGASSHGGNGAAPAQESAKQDQPEAEPQAAPAAKEQPEPAAKAEAKPEPKPADKPAAKAPPKPEPTPKAAKDEAPDDGADDEPRGPVSTPLKGAAARVVQNMESSLAVPTATSVRSVPAKLLADNRIVINSHLKRSRGGKVSFTHLIGYALVRAVADVPVMNRAYGEVDGKPVMLEPDNVGLGLAIDLQNANGSRSLVVAAIKNADTMDFAAYWTAYEDIVRRARGGKLTTEDFQGTTISLTNPGGIGTVHSVPRLMQGAGAIIGVGAMEYPAEFQGASEETLARLAVSKTITLTSTYDHRIIQGAQSGEFLRRMHQLLLGEDGFYDDVFRSLRIPYVPVRWVPDAQASHEGDLDKATRVNELIHAYRVRGHLMADTDPLEFKVRSHPGPRRQHPRPVAVGPRPRVPGRRLRRQEDDEAARRPRRPARLLLPHHRHRVHAHAGPGRAPLAAGAPGAEGAGARPRRAAARAAAPERRGGVRDLPADQVRRPEALLARGRRVAHPAARRRPAARGRRGPGRGRHRDAAPRPPQRAGQQRRQELRADLPGVRGQPRPAHRARLRRREVPPRRRGRVHQPGRQQRRRQPAGQPLAPRGRQPRARGRGAGEAGHDQQGRAGLHRACPVLLHGDAAFAGQGVVAETLQMAQLRGYRTGGTVHVVVNNQVGFTTGPHSARSSVYATDVARMVQAPIFHVNGDDPEACVRVAKLAFDYRQAFKKDVVIDMVCYRRRGHSEVDEPSFTQPLMYDTIDAKRSVRKIYTENLIGRGDITVEEAEEALRDYQEQLEKVFQGTREAANAAPMRPEPEATGEDDLTTAISREVVKAIADSQVTLPEGFTAHPRLLPQMQKRAKMIDDGTIDWAMGETLAFGSLLIEGRPVRLAGQDARRGTFGHRHAVIVDRKNGSEHTPLANLTKDQAPYYVYDSLLSEFAAMGFEYGYSVARPEALVLWEAQFGDFVNGAMTIVDEFIAAGEAKWGQRSGVVLLLPHGYEGQGPDHSSARLERFLQLCAEENMVVAAPTTPASYFHLLRRQALQSHKRPLVIMSPKSMLRLRAATSPTEDFTERGFLPVLGDPDSPDPAGVTRVVLTTGKVHYDLLAARRKAEESSVALVRVEQLYPLPGEEIADALAGYPNATDVVWAQEEPANQGAWQYIAMALPDHLPEGRVLRRLSRKAGASPAAGSSKVHEAEQAALLAAAFAR
jgi:2-oxoglutarate dehydrogenase E1 component